MRNNVKIYDYLRVLARLEIIDGGSSKGHLAFFFKDTEATQLLGQLVSYYSNEE